MLPGACVGGVLLLLAIFVQLYRGLKASVRWNGSQSSFFTGTRGMSQGSLLSWHLFNIFADDLLQHLALSEYGICIGYSKVSAFAYADDIYLMSTSVPGLHMFVSLKIQ